MTVVEFKSNSGSVKVNSEDMPYMCGNTKTKQQKLFA